MIIMVIKRYIILSTITIVLEIMRITVRTIILFITVITMILKKH